MNVSRVFVYVFETGGRRHVKHVGEGRSAGSPRVSPRPFIFVTYPIAREGSTEVCHDEQVVVRLALFCGSGSSSPAITKTLQQS